MNKKNTACFLFFAAAGIFCLVGSFFKPGLIPLGIFAFFLARRHLRNPEWY